MGSCLRKNESKVEKDDKINNPIEGMKTWDIAAEEMENKLLKESIEEPVFLKALFPMECNLEAEIKQKMLNDVTKAKSREDEAMILDSRMKVDETVMKENPLGAGWDQGRFWSCMWVPESIMTMRHFLEVNQVPMDEFKHEAAFIAFCKQNNWVNTSDKYFEMWQSAQEQASTASARVLQAAIARFAVVLKISDCFISHKGDYCRAYTVSSHDKISVCKACSFITNSLSQQIGIEVKWHCDHLFTEDIYSEKSQKKEEYITRKDACGIKLYQLEYTTLCEDTSNNTSNKNDLRFSKLVGRERDEISYNNNTNRKYDILKNNYYAPLTNFDLNKLSKKCSSLESFESEFICKSQGQYYKRLDLYRSMLQNPLSNYSSTGSVRNMSFYKNHNNNDFRKDLQTAPASRNVTIYHSNNYKTRGIVKKPLVKKIENFGNIDSKIGSCTLKKASLIKKIKHIKIESPMKSTYIYRSSGKNIHIQKNEKCNNNVPINLSTSIYPSLNTNYLYTYQKVPFQSIQNNNNLNIMDNFDFDQTLNISIRNSTDSDHSIFSEKVKNNRSCLSDNNYICNSFLDRCIKYIMKKPLQYKDNLFFPKHVSIFKNYFKVIYLKNNIENRTKVKLLAILQTRLDIKRVNRIKNKRMTSKINFIQKCINDLPCLKFGNKNFPNKILCNLNFLLIAVPDLIKIEDKLDRLICHYNCFGSVMKTSKKTNVSYVVMRGDKSDIDKLRSSLKNVLVLNYSLEDQDIILK